MKTFLSERVIVKTGDITQEVCDAIVNAANSSLMGGGGVDGAIHRVGGPSILEECKIIRKEKLPHGLPTGEAIMTNAGNLPSNYVIHTVGPIWQNGNQKESEKLANCYENSLKIAFEMNLDSIAFPSISTGVFGYPLENASVISSTTVENFLQKHEFPRRVIFVFFSNRDMDIFLNHQKFGKSTN